MLPWRSLEKREGVLAAVAGTVTLNQDGQEVEYAILTADELDAAQIGYATHVLTGQSLIGSSDGDWQLSWLTIGSDTLCGDPIFVDMADPALPVLTAPHGAGTWRPERLSASFEDFAAKVQRVE